MQYAKVIVDIATPEVDRVFDYRLPAHLEKVAQAGHRVIVPFGRRNAKTEGYILTLSHSTEIPLGRMKEVLEILDDGKVLFTPEMLTLAQWMKMKYFCTLSQCLQTIMPSGIRTKSKWTVYPTEAFFEEEFSGVEAIIARLLLESPQGISLMEIEKEVGKAYQAPLKNMEERGLVLREQTVGRGAFQKERRYISCNEGHPDFARVLAKMETDKRLLGQREVLSFLLEKGETSLDVMAEMSFRSSSIKTLLAKGMLVERREDLLRSVFDLEDFQRTTSFVPTKEQEAVLSALAAEGTKTDKRPVLLHGVTGSGKTEIYLQQISKAVAAGQQAIVLVPEISLTPQMLERFISRFGAMVSVTHSRLSVGERLDQWKKAREGEISVMIGPRSAIFTPFANLGVIIIDEVHENSYVSEVTPKYDARQVARQLAKQTGALLVMGSATPDLESYYKAISGEYLLLELKERTGGGQLPQMKIVDMRRELAEGNRSAFSRELQGAVEENLAKGEQTILFLNRRGFATFVSCRSCGYVMKCPDCDVTYTYHASDNRLQCHYCGRSEKNPALCPSCGSKYIRYFGTGTQKIEEEARKLFPQARILRMDLDTTTAKGSHDRILRAFGKGQADILIGTQMIAKGHDFPGVTLVGIMAADTSLNTGSYFAAETTFSLITQAGGRAGRDKKPGWVFVQTYDPDHYAVRYGAKQDYVGFYREESQFRRLMDYPPFGVFFSVLVTGADEAVTKNAAEKLAKILEEMDQEKAFSVMGPTPAMISRFRGAYRQRMMIQGAEEKKLIDFVLASVEKTKKETKKEVLFNLTLNPHNIV